MVMLLLATSKLLMMKGLRVRELLSEAMGLLLYSIKNFRRLKKVLGFIVQLKSS